MNHELVKFLPILLSIILLGLAVKFVDWKKRETYARTVLFAICVDFFISILTYKHSLWYFHPAFLIPNHTIADFMIAFTNIPLIVLLFLSHYPYGTSILKQGVYITLWSVLFTIIETIFLFTNLLSYHNGWTSWWSFIVWIFTFISLILHQKKPIIVWALCFSCTIFLVLYFHIPVLKLK